MNDRNNQSKQKGSHHKENSSLMTSKSKKKIHDKSNFEDVDETGEEFKPYKDITIESESKVSSVAQTPVHTITTKTRGLMPDKKNTPIMIDLFDSQDTSVMSKGNGTLLESGDNPVCSFSSKAGVIGFKAFQSRDNLRAKQEEIITLPVNENAANSSLADMFMSK